MAISALDIGLKPVRNQPTEAQLVYLEEVTLTLENDRRFYEEYLSLLHGTVPPGEKTLLNCIRYHAVRLCSKAWLRVSAAPAGSVSYLLDYFDQRYRDEVKAKPEPTVDELAKQLLQQPMFVDRYTQMLQAGAPPLHRRSCIRLYAPSGILQLVLKHMEAIDWFFLDHFQPLPQVLVRKETDHSETSLTTASTSTQLTQEPIMKNDTAIKITTLTLVNGVDVSTLENSQIYDMIAEQERQIEKLNAIKNKPARLQQEITERLNGINALVNYLNVKDGAASKSGETPAKDLPKDLPKELPKALPMTGTTNEA